LEKFDILTVSMGIEKKPSPGLNFEKLKKLGTNFSTIVSNAFFPPFRSIFNFFGKIGKDMMASIEKTLPK